MGTNYYAIKKKPSLYNRKIHENFSYDTKNIDGYRFVDRDFS